MARSTRRVCSHPGCPTITDQPRCRAHRLLLGQTVGTTTERGYGHAHQRTRQAWADKVAAGQVICWRCRELIDPLEAWDLGHEGRVTRGPEHAGRCNRSGARYS